MTEAQPRSLYTSLSYYTVKKPIAHTLANTKNWLSTSFAEALSKLVWPKGSFDKI